tara:strand:+ start:4571 stop:4720 length:150 start_codon:yes stop_codon:yes gene_type:complete
MKLATKVCLFVIIGGALFEGGYQKSYHCAYNLFLIALIILFTALNENRK